MDNKKTHNDSKIYFTFACSSHARSDHKIFNLKNVKKKWKKKKKNG